MAEKKEVKAEEVKEVKGPKLVKIKIPRDRQRGDMVVGVNGKFNHYKRGVELEVPESFAEVINRSIEQDERAADLIDTQRTD